MDWFERWKSPEYKKYLQLIESHSNRVANFKISAVQVKSPLIITGIDQETYSVTLPIYKDAYVALEQTTDAKERTYITNYIRIMKRKANHNLSNLIHTRSQLEYKEAIQHAKTYGLLEPYSAAPIYYIERLPVITETTEKPEKPILKRKIKKQKEYKDVVLPGKKRIPSPKLSKNSRERLKEKSLEKVLSRSLGELLPFKTRDECISRATKQKYYISKSDLVDLINKTPKLKEKVGDKVASLTKEQICDKFFE